MTLDRPLVALGLPQVLSAGSDSGTTIGSDESQSTKDERSEAEVEAGTENGNKFLGNEFEVNKKMEKERPEEYKWDFAVPDENGEGWTKESYRIGMKGFLRVN